MFHFDAVEDNVTAILLKKRKKEIAIAWDFEIVRRFT